MISNYQYERLVYFIENVKLQYEELSMIDAFLADPRMDDRIPWLLDVLRKRGYR